MEKIEKEQLKKYANTLMFDMSEEEYKELEKEFPKIITELEKLENYPDIEELEPMIFPYEIENKFREDEVKEILEIDDVVANAKEVIGREIKVPKVVD